MPTFTPPTTPGIDHRCSSSRLAFVLFAGLALIACLLSSPQVRAEQPGRPNVVIIITDDQGYGDLSCHGNTMLKTPHLDKLHAQSVRLTNFHTDPTCAPTRAALLTGRYSLRTGIWHTIAGRSLMRPDEVTLAEHLRGHGYNTGIFGKWHLGDNYPCRPQDQGFEHTLIHGGGGVGQIPDHWRNDYFDDTYLLQGKPTPFKGYCTDVWFDEAIKYIEGRKDKPFLAYITTNAPHDPFLVDDKYSRPFIEQGIEERVAKFYGMIVNIDENVGKLMAKLDELKISDNTIVIFMTDNGTSAGVHRPNAPGPWKGFSAGMRAAKGSVYDGGHRVPFFIRWPGKIGDPRDVTPLTAHIDVLPTLCELIGINPPKDVPLDGVSLVPLLKEAQSPKTPWPARTICVDSQRVENPIKWKDCAVMTDRWRLINGRELYDMAVDPGQKKNVAADHPEVVQQLRGEYEKWWASVSTRFDEMVPIVVGSPQENPSMLTCHDWHPEPRSGIAYQGGLFPGTFRGNGFWALQVAQKGRYEITLWRWPEAEGKPLEATAAKIRIGAIEVTAKPVEGAKSVTMEVDLEQGPMRFQTWLTDEKGTHGAWYVQVRRK